MTNRDLPLPNHSTEPYWTAARRGELLIQRCTTCQRYQFYPRAHCRFCLHGDPEWVLATGRGRLYSFTVVRRTADPWFSQITPYVLALVDLDEGVRITANVPVDDPRRLRCDQTVLVSMKPVTENISLPFAVPEPTP